SRIFDQPRLRAGVPQAVIAEIGSGRGIVGAIPLHAVGRCVAFNRRGGHGHDAIIIVPVVIIVVAVIAGAVIAVGTRRQRAAYDCAGNRARPEAAAMVVMIPAAIAARPAAETAAGDPCSAELLAATSAHAATHAHAAAAHMAAATHVAAAAHMGAAAATASTVILGETGGRRCRQR